MSTNITTPNLNPLKNLLMNEKSLNAPSDFVNGIKLSTATQVTTADKIPVLDENLKINTWIKPENLPPIKELLEDVNELKKRLESLEKE